MTRIVVIGANGQVGSEVCLALSALPGVEVVAVVRSELAGVLLERCGVRVRTGTISADASLLEGADLVADFSLPGGLPSQIEGGAAQTLSAGITRAPAGVPYVYCSSTMAFGMDPAGGKYVERVIARTQYASTKRRSEREALRLGRAARRPVYVFRLGQVHGELQSVSRSWAQRLRSASSPITVRRHSTDVVFVGTIALALAALASGRGADSPGTYTLLDNPEWTLDEVVTYYAERLAVPHPTVIESNGPASLKGVVTGALRRAIVGQRELVTAHLLPRWLDIEWAAKARWLRARARRELAISASEPFEAMVGPVPGERLECLRGSRSDALELQQEVRARLDRALGSDSHVFDGALDDGLSSRRLATSK